MRQLQPRQKEFCKHYIITNNGTESAKLAGFQGKSNYALAVTANRLLKRDNVKQEIEKLTNSLSSDLSVTIEYITKKLKSIVNDCKSSNSDKIRALELLGKNIGYAKQENQTLALFGSDLILKLTNKVKTSLNRVKTDDIPQIHDITEGVGVEEDTADKEEQGTEIYGDIPK